MMRLQSLAVFSINGALAMEGLSIPESAVSCRFFWDGPRVWCVSCLMTHGIEPK